MSPWLQTFQRRHNIAVVLLLALALVMLATPFLPSLSLSIQLIILAIAVVILGLPHGALDLTLVQGTSNGSWLVLASSALVYLLGSVAVIAAWLMIPVPALVSFLMIALVHFGLGDTAELRGIQRALEVGARGGLSTVAPLVFQPQTTLALFALLVGPGAAGTLSAAHEAIMPLGGWLWGTCLVAAVLWRVISLKPGWLQATLELVLTSAVFALLHPLAAFLLYFGFVHSIRHLAELGAARFPGSANRAGRWLMLESLPFTAATLVLAGFAWFAFGGSVSFDEGLIRILFWGLSALTVPHMILVAWWHARGKCQPGDLLASKFKKIAEFPPVTGGGENSRKSELKSR